MSKFRELLGGASVAHGVRESIVILLDNAITTEHTMKACIEIHKAEPQSEEEEELTTALLMDILGRMEVQMDKAINHLKRKEE